MKLKFLYFADFQGMNYLDLLNPKLLKLLSAIRGANWWFSARLCNSSTLRTELLQSCFFLLKMAGFEISLVRSSEKSTNDSQTSGILAGLVRRMTAYFWFSHKLHWFCIFQTSEWYIRTSDFYNPLAQQTSAFNLKFWSLNGLNGFHFILMGISLSLVRFLMRAHKAHMLDGW